jgi:hypothetical protein
MKWCCMGFEGNFQMAGSRGFGVFVSTYHNSEPAFVLQHRSVDPGIQLRTRRTRSLSFLTCKSNSARGAASN